MIRLRSCCCGCSLTTGSILILIYFFIPGCAALLKAFQTDGVEKIFLLFWGVITSLIVILGFLAVRLRKPKLLIPALVYAFFGALRPILTLILLLIFGTLVAVLSTSHYVFDEGPRQNTSVQFSQSINSTYRKNESMEGFRNADSGTSSTTLSSLIIEAVLNPYFFLVLLSYYFELKEDLWRSPSGNAKEGESPYPRRTQNYERDSDSEMILVPASGSVSK